MGCHALLQGIFPTQKSNTHLLCLLIWQTDSLRSKLSFRAPYSGEILRILKRNRDKEINTGFLILPGLRSRAYTLIKKNYLTFKYFVISSVQSISCVQLFATPWIARHQASLSITNSRSSLRRPSSQWCHPAISSSVFPFSFCPQSLPASESFPMSQLFAWGGQSTGVSASASFLPKKSQGWCLSEWTRWISLSSKGLSRVFSNTTVQKHQFFGTQPSSQSNSHIHIWPQEKP